MDPTIAPVSPSRAEATSHAVIAEHIEIRPGYCGGKPHIAGHRIKVQHVAIWHEQMSLSPREIVAGHPGITLADVHAALAYYYDHREEIEADIRDDDAFIETLRAGAPSVSEKFRARRSSEPR